MYESGRIPALRWPLEVGANGQLETVRSISEGWAQRVKSIVTTRMRDRVMRSTYGCAVSDNLFQNVPTEDPERLIRQSLASWAPQIEVSTVDVGYGTSSEVVINVEYRIPGGSVQQIQTAFASPAGEVRS